MAGLSDLLLRRLRDEQERDGALSLFLRYRGKEAVQPFEAGMRQNVQAAMANPAVQAEFQKVGRSVTYAGTTAGWPDF